MMPPRLPAAMVFQKHLGAPILLLTLAALFIWPSSARSAEFTDAAGRRVILPDSIRHVMPANPSAAVLVFTLAPDRLAGVSRPPRRGTQAAQLRSLPVLGGHAEPDPAEMVDTARRLRPEVIVDAGVVAPERAAFADQVQQQTGIPYILVDDHLASTPAVIRAVGQVLGVGNRAKDLGLYAEQAIAALRGRLLIRAPDARPRVYYGRGADGLETPLPGSAIDEAGAINVAAPLGRGAGAVVTREQILAWDPEIVIAEQRSFYDALRRSPAWGHLAAVRRKRVYLAPAYPYGWIDDPPGINRLIGLYWLSSLFYPDVTEEDLRSVACGFYDKFYGIKLTNAELEALVGPASAPSLATDRSVLVVLDRLQNVLENHFGELRSSTAEQQMPGTAGEPLVGLGAAPQLTPPGTSSVPASKPTPNEPCTLAGTTSPFAMTPDMTAPDSAPQQGGARDDRARRSTAGPARPRRNAGAGQP